MIRKILFFADGESPDEKALAYAASVAAYLDASLTVVSVVKPSPRWVLTRGADLNLDELQQMMVEDRHRELEQAVRGTLGANVDVTVDVLVGTPAAAVIRAVMSDGYDLVIKAHAPADGMRRRLFGGTDDRLMRASPCPVTILGDDRGETPRRAIAALDYEPADESKAELN